jgi:hypothetical protein
MSVPCLPGRRIFKPPMTAADEHGVKPLVAPVALNGEAALAPIWDEWGRLTRFLESARLAFARERSLWASLELCSAEDIKLSAASAHGTYRVALNQHLAAVSDEETLLASVLIHSYALAESAAARRLGGEARDYGGIEDWGARLLATTDTTWNALAGGIAGAVEVSVVRNAYAHGGRRIDQAAVRRLHAVGRTHPRVRDPVTLDYATLRVFRGRLRALLGLGGVGG